MLRFLFNASEIADDPSETGDNSSVNWTLIILLSKVHFTELS